MKLEFKQLANDKKRGWVHLQDGLKMKFAFLEWKDSCPEINHLKGEWVLRELSWLTQINADSTMKTETAVTHDELRQLSEFMRFLPSPV